MTSNAKPLSKTMKDKLIEAAQDPSHEVICKENTWHALRERGLAYWGELKHRVLDGQGHQVRTHGIILTDAGLAEARRLAGESEPVEVEVAPVRYERRAGGNGHPYQIDELETVHVRGEVERAQRAGVLVTVEERGVIRVHGERPVRFFPLEETPVAEEPVEAEAQPEAKPEAEVKVAEGTYRMYVGLLREDAKDMGTVWAAQVRQAIANRHGWPVELLDDGVSVRVGYSFFVPEWRVLRERQKAVAERDREAGVVSDELLDLREVGCNQGEANAAKYLRPLSPDQRVLAEREAWAFQSTTPGGWNWSGSVYEAAKNVRAGRTPGLDRAAALMAHDPDGTKAAAQAARGGSWGEFVGAAEASAQEAASAPQEAAEEPQQAGEEARREEEAAEKLVRLETSERVGAQRVVRKVRERLTEELGQDPLASLVWRQVGEDVGRHSLSDPWLAVVYRALDEGGSQEEARQAVAEAQLEYAKTAKPLSALMVAHLLEALADGSHRVRATDATKLALRDRALCDRVRIEEEDELPRFEERLTEAGVARAREVAGRSAAGRWEGLHRVWGQLGEQTLQDLAQALLAPSGYEMRQGERVLRRMTHRQAVETLATALRGTRPVEVSPEGWVTITASEKIAEEKGHLVMVPVAGAAHSHPLEADPVPADTAVYEAMPGRRVEGEELRRTAEVLEHEEYVVQLRSEGRWVLPNHDDPSVVRRGRLASVLRGQAVHGSPGAVRFSVVADGTVYLSTGRQAARYLPVTLLADYVPGHCPGCGQPSDSNGDGPCPGR